MNKSLDLHIFRNSASNLANLFQRQFSCCHHSLGSHLIPELVCTIIGVICLSTNVTFDLRTYFFCDLIDSRIRNNQCIRSDFPEFFKILPDALQILIMCQNISCDVYFYTMFVGKPYPF